MDKEKDYFYRLTNSQNLSFELIGLIVLTVSYIEENIARINRDILSSELRYDKSDNKMLQKILRFEKDGAVVEFDGEKEKKYDCILKSRNKAFTVEVLIDLLNKLEQIHE